MATQAASAYAAAARSGSYAKAVKAAGGGAFLSAKAPPGGYTNCILAAGQAACPGDGSPTPTPGTSPKPTLGTSPTPKPKPTPSGGGGRLRYSLQINLRGRGGAKPYQIPAAAKTELAGWTGAQLFAQIDSAAIKVSVTPGSVVLQWTSAALVSQVRDSGLCCVGEGRSLVKRGLRRQSLRPAAGVRRTASCWTNQNFLPRACVPPPQVIKNAERRLTPVGCPPSIYTPMRQVEAILSQPAFQVASFAFSAGARGHVRGRGGGGRGGSPRCQVKAEVPPRELPAQQECRSAQIVRECR